MSLQHSSETPKTTKPQHDLDCGSIIDAQGREVPITDEMIKKACEDLEKSRVERTNKA
ncbi:PA1571 family protein [Pseudomonas urmiensis]|uniref:PA1571 family protein n=1 Tax=Pseudomonas urmiensis TaxID=2745493 RepID=UPI003C886B9D